MDLDDEQEDMIAPRRLWSRRPQSTYMVESSDSDQDSHSSMKDAHVHSPGLRFSSSEPEEYSEDDGEYFGSNEEGLHHSKPRKQNRPQTRKQPRNIIAATSLSRTLQVTQQPPVQAETSSFTFLRQEKYSCSCLSSSLGPEACTVLGFFEFKFFQGWKAIFCHTHNCFIPASNLEKHLKTSHKEWTSPTKGQESRDMASHIIMTCGLDVNQTEADVKSQLPDELEKPLTSTALLFQRYQCPFCLCCIRMNNGEGKPDRYLRFKHLPDCPPFREKRISVIQAKIGKARYFYRVNIGSGNQVTHFFSLPSSWSSPGGKQDDYSDSELSFPPFSPGAMPSTETTELTQDWPVRLGWESYSTEIGADAHIGHLKRLIRRCRRAGSRHLHFLESGISYIRKYTMRYLTEGGLALAGSHVSLKKLLISE
jgi:hypothetical protein